MTEERQADPTAGTEGSTGDAVESSGAQTVEEVEAFWRNRSSGKDRAHNAETTALKAQIEALKTAPAPGPSGESPEAEQVRTLREELAAAHVVAGGWLLVARRTGSLLVTSTLATSNQHLASSRARER